MRLLKVIFLASLFGVLPVVMQAAAEQGAAVSNAIHSTSEVVANAGEHAAANADHTTGSTHVEHHAKAFPLLRR
jgi:hypothetical protein